MKLSIYEIFDLMKSLIYEMQIKINQLILSK